MVLRVNPTIAILGGTGKEGKGLGYRFANKGLKVCIGSRTLEKAQETASELMGLINRPVIIQGYSNLEAAAISDIVVLTVPYSAHRPVLENLKSSLTGKILIDVTVPLVPPKVTKVQMPAAGSAAQEAYSILGEGVRLASAFHHISYENLLLEEDIDCDVFVTGTSQETRKDVLGLVAAIGLQGWDAGPIENSVVLEGLTSILIGINKQFGKTSAGIRITGIKNNGQLP
jgi:8-hydroxy-5-deazaflavin:NADPH oxidoreductase